ncbi:hypothetical protein HO173_007531 [Letharia columbiana]|uniref:Uncharacterized protein n=1 Tax=Letharia columbiana TaxID=112416 RepID=A0A8H6FSW1_9LECA|nr:uncharacterized protein HO173_007531 [Letharia columbiana]KAF6234112.1 hypothetical protein HO173_007531 [Letharia columbiana]
MFARTVHRALLRPVAVASRRSVATLEGNPYIYVFPDDRSINSHILSLLSYAPPRAELAVGTTTKLPPTPDSFTENHRFLDILQSVIAQHACEDVNVISQAQAMASTSGSSLGSGGAFFPQQQQKRRGTAYGGGGGTGGDGAGGASSQGGAGGGGRGGYIHVYDERHPPDFGRIPDPEDIFGSLEVDGEGKFVDGHGRYQSSGSYRVVTRDGFLGLSPFLRQKLVERLKLEDANLR